MHRLLYIVSSHKLNGLVQKAYFLEFSIQYAGYTVGRRGRAGLYKHTSSSNRNKIITPPPLPLHSSGIIHMLLYSTAMNGTFCVGMMSLYVCVSVCVSKMSEK